MNVFKLSFMCNICLRGKIAKRKMQQIQNKSKLTREENDDLIKFKKWLNEKEEHLSKAWHQRESLRKRQLNLEINTESIIYQDFTKFYSYFSDLIQVIEYKDSNQNIQRKYIHYIIHKNICNSDHKFVRCCCDFLFKKTNFVQQFKKIHFWSDGSRGQFKCKENLYYITTLTKNFNVDVDYNFFVSNHGHNICGAEAGHCKGILRKVQRLEGLKINNVNDIVQILENYF